MQSGCKVIFCNLNKRLLLPYLRFTGKSYWENLLLEQECRLNKKFDYKLRKENEHVGLRALADCILPRHCAEHRTPH
jgi:hypothetical protein